MILPGLILACAACALEPGSDDYSAFIAAEANRLSAPAEPDALARALGVADLLASRVNAPARVSVSTVAPLGAVAQARVSFASAAGVSQALLLTPTQKGGPRPVVLLLHDGAGAVAAREAVGRRLAEKGLLVLIPERLGSRDPGREFDDAFNLLLVGRSLPGLRVYENALMLDWLSTLPEADRSKVAVVGLGTGSVLARLTAGVDPRVRALAIDAALRSEPYYDWAADLLAPGLLRFAGRAPAAAVYSGALGFPGGGLASWLAAVLSGRPVPAAPAGEEDPVERLFRIYKGYAPGGSEDLFSYNLALSYRRRGKFDLAAAELERALERQPERPLLLKTLAELQEQAGRRESAAKTLARLAAATTDRAEQARVRETLGRAYLRQGRLSAAEEQFAQILRLDAERHEIRAERARLLVRLGRRAEAREELGELLTKAPESFPGRMELARLLIQAGELDAAVRELERAVEIAPESVQAHVALGRVYQMRGDDDAAEQELKAARRSEPGMLEAALALGDYYAERRRWPEARAVYEAVLSQAPGLIEARLALADVFRAVGQAERSRKEYGAAIALDRRLTLDLANERRRCEALGARLDAVSALAK